MYKGPIIDCDLHNTWESSGELAEYLPKEWREFAEGPGKGQLLSVIPSIPTYMLLHGHNKRLDTFPPDGGEPGSDYQMTKDQLLDPFGIERAILHFDTGLNVAHPNPYFARALSQAANDWCMERWLDGRDERLYGAVMAPNQLPDEAAEEIRRVGEHSQMVEVLFGANGLGKSLGHPIYHPIYQAAADLDLTVGIHIAIVGAAPEYAGGRPSSRLEFLALAWQPAQHHLLSLLTHGVFEKFPTLRVMLIEVGVSWIPWMLWHLDAYYDELRRESPLVKRLPSEYFRDHVRITTQPFERSTQPEQLIDLLEAFGGVEDLLCFASDYPHWDGDDPAYLARRLPKDWLPKVFYENALKFYRWPLSVGTESGNPRGPAEVQ